MTNLDKLIQQFERFPGIGARQAKRFAFHILTLPPEEVEELSRLISTLPLSVTECHRCHRFFSAHSPSQILCNVCDDPNRDHTKLMVVERDSDVTALERAGAYDGLYFVLGGTVPLLQNPDTGKLRGSALKAAVTNSVVDGLSEIILAFSVNPDGENTARFVDTILKDVLVGTTIKMSQLGRGLSTGSELEYADPETIKSALQSRN
jgi:recombination protein RecR